MANRKSFLLLTCALIMVSALAVSGASAADNPTGYSYARIVRLSFVSGDVQIVRTDKSNKWEPAVLNMPVEQGFAIGTNNGRAEIELEHGSTIWLAENSVLQFTELALANGGRITRVTLSDGTAAFETSLSPGDTFEVATPSFRAAAAKSSQFRINLREKAGDVSVFAGKVAVNDAGGTQEVPKGETFATRGKSSQDAVVRNPAADEFDHWVSSRSSSKAAGETQSATYTAAPFTYGMADLAGYGSWNYFPGYGYGWQPWGAAPGWAPFMAGQWMYYPSFGWSWISSEPWGWVPYHFGAWNYSAQFGWMWMPGDYSAWTGAPVEWVNVGDQIGWIPRSSGSAAGSTPAPVIVSTKKLGKVGKNRVFGPSELSGRVRPLANAPEENGNVGAASAQARSLVIVPTAGNLESLRAGLAANPGAKIDLRNAAGNASSFHQTAPDREFAPINAAMAAPKMPGRPPMRAAIISDFSAAEDPRGTSTMAQPSQATPLQSSHATTSSSSSASSGKPH